MPLCFPAGFAGFLRPEQMAGAEAVGVGSAGTAVGLVAIPGDAAARCCCWELS